jgi:retinol dehydrogenase 12
MASRNQEKAEAAITELKAETGKEAIFLKLDLANLKSVKAAAEEFKKCVLLPELAVTEVELTVC